MKDRMTIKFSKLRKMMNESIVKLPKPVEMRGRKMRWVGIGWVDEGEADGTEPLLVVD